MPTIDNEMTWETLAIPLVAGLDLNTRARLVDPTKLLEATNCIFPRGGGPEKRPGNRALTVFDASVIGPGRVPANYLYGWGRYDEDNTSLMDIATPEQESPYGDAGDLTMVTARDTEVVCLDRHRLFSKTARGFTRPQYNPTPNGDPTSKHFFRPTFESKPIGKIATNQAFSDLADNGVIKVMAFKDGPSVVRVKCFDSVTNALRFDETFANTTDPEYLKVVNVGEFIHVYVSDININELLVSIVRNHDLSLPTSFSLGECEAVFDVEKVNEGLVLTGRLLGAGLVSLGYLNANGTVNSTYMSFGYTPPEIVDCTKFGIAVHPLTGDIGVVVNTTGPTTQGFLCYTRNGVSTGFPVALGTDILVVNVSIVPYYLTTTTGESVFQVYIGAGTPYFVETHLVSASGVTSTTIAKMWNVHLVSKPFRIGNVPFVWVCRGSTLQTSYLLVDRFLNVVGKAEYATAVDNSADTWLFSCNTLETEPYRVHGALLYRQRTSNQDGIYHEQSTKEFRLDFDPVTTCASAGRCLYFSGMQLTQYDGEKLVETGFHFGPEDLTLTPSNGAGSIEEGVRQYRVFLAHKNAQGEEVRSLCITTPELTLSAPNDTVTLVGDTIPTLRNDSYLLVYRNLNGGTVWHLVSDRNPSSAQCPKNNQAAATWTFVDTVSDVALEDNEIDNTTASGFLLPFSAPSCTIVAQGKDRLWLAGGEIPAGEIWPSRLYTTNETPTFNPALSLTIDRDIEPFTCIGFVADYVAVFKKTKTYIVAGPGLNNTLVGENFQAQLAVSDIGAISAFYARVAPGLVFQSISGYRLFTPSGSVEAIGVPVDSLVGDCRGIVVDTTTYNVRCYQSSGFTLVYDYSSGEWTKWTLTPTYAANINGVVYTTVGDRLYVEEAGLYTDDGKNYPYKFRTAWIGRQLGGHQRIRKIGGIGETDDQSYLIDVNVYMDEKPYPIDTFSDVRPIQNTSTWGDGSWGDGLWGDSQGGGTVSLFARDAVWRWVRRPRTQKCSCVSVEVTYIGSGRGPVHTAITLEVGNRKGLDRVPRQ